MINLYFNTDAKKDNKLRKVFHANEFYIRFFKKLY